VNVVVDIGNTRTKLCLFDGDLIHKSIITEHITRESLVHFIDNNEVAKVIVSSVGEFPLDIHDFLQTQFKKYVVFSSQTKVPIKNTYKSPQTLGVDRLAAAVAANYLFPSTNVLVIDCGTAITYDYIDKTNCFLGGNISPGINTRFKALHSFTNKLPLLGKLDEWHMIGEDTESAIVSGVLQGVMDELTAYIQRFEQQFPVSKVLLTGGDALYLTQKIKNEIIFEPYLVVKGLNCILNYNDKD